MGSSDKREDTAERGHYSWINFLFKMAAEYII